MANTKQITDGSERKSKKRAQRKEFKAAFSAMTKDQKRRFRKGEITGMRKFLAEESANS